MKTNKRAALLLGTPVYSYFFNLENNIFKEIDGVFNVHCGGSIYNKSTIITAGHCCDNFDDPNNFPLSDTRIIAGQIEISGRVRKKNLTVVAIGKFTSAVL